MAEDNLNTNTATKSNEEVFFDNIRGKHEDFGDDREKYFEYANKRFSGLKDENKKYRDDVDAIYGAVNENPVLSTLFDRSARFPHNPSLALRSFSKEDLQNALDHYDDVVDEENEAEALKQWRENDQREKARQKKIKDNQAEIPNIIEEFAKTNKVSVEDVDNLLAEIISPLAEGKLSKEFLDMVHYYKNRDNEKKSEYERGLAEGRNAKIEEKNLRRETKTDGLPETRGGEKADIDNNSARPKNLVDKLTRKNSWEEMTER